MPYPLDMARDLVTNGDTGQQRVAGNVGEAFSVLSPVVGFRERPVYVIAINLGGQAVLLSHPVSDEPPTPSGAGLYGSLDSFSEQATNFPQGSMTDEGARGFAEETARDCLTLP